MSEKTKVLTDSQVATLQNFDPNATIAEPNLGYVGPYKILRELGRGGMGTVYLCRHASLQRSLALKVLPREFANSSDRLARFRREMAAIGRLDHPNIVLATDAGEVDGMAYIAMQYLEGMDVSALLKRDRALAVADSAEIIRQAAVGLQHIHESGLVHRDIKPSNLFLTQYGEIKILDLGLAMLRESDGSSSTITAPNAIMGTPDFIAPEQINSSHSVDIRADIYSLGCTLYALLSGQAPFEGQQFSTTTSKLIAHAEKNAISLKLIKPELADSLVQLVERMMAKSPDQRFAQPKMVADELARWAAGANLKLLHDQQSLPMAQPNIEQNSQRPSTRKYVVLATTATVLIASLAGALFNILGKPRPEVEQASSQSITLDRANRGGNGPTEQTKADDSTLSVDTASQENAVSDPIAKAIQTAPVQAAEMPAPSTAQAATQPTVNSSTQPTGSADSALQQISKSAQSIETSNQAVVANTAKISQSLDELLKHLKEKEAELSKPVSDPRSAGEHYYNALVYGIQGNPRLARKSFLAYFEFDQDFIDPHLKFIETLTLQEGKSSVRELYKSLPGDRSHLSRRFAEATLLDPPDRKELLQSMVLENEAFAPAWFALSEFYTGSGNTQPTLADLSQEINYLKKFFAAHERGGLLKYYLDPSEAAVILGKAQSRLKVLEQFDPKRIAQPVMLGTVMKVGNNWQATIEVAESAQEIFLRIGEDGDFQSLGKSSGVDPITGAPVLKKSFAIPGTVRNALLHIRYVDRKDQMCGPYTLPFDAQVQNQKWEMTSIASLKPNWLRLMDDRLFFDVFHSGRTVLKEVRYGVDVEKPDKVKPIPKDDFTAENSREYYEPVLATSKFAVIQLTFTDGTQSEIVRIEKR